MLTRLGRRTGRTPHWEVPQRTGAASSTGQTGVPFRVPPLRLPPDRVRLLARTTRARHRVPRGVEDLGLVVCHRTARASPRLCRACWALAGDLHLRRLRRPVGSGKCCKDWRVGRRDRICKILRAHILMQKTKGTRAPVVHPKAAALIPFPSHRHHRQSAKLGAQTPPHALLPRRQAPLYDLNFTPNFFFIEATCNHPKKKVPRSDRLPFSRCHRPPLNFGTQVRANLASIVLSSPRSLSLNPPDLFYSCVTTVTVSTTSKIHSFHAALDPSPLTHVFHVLMFCGWCAGFNINVFTLFLFSLSLRFRVVSVSTFPDP